MLAYDLTAAALGIRNLASGIVVTAERPSKSPEGAALHALEIQ